MVVKGISQLPYLWPIHNHRINVRLCIGKHYMRNPHLTAINGKMFTLVAMLLEPLEINVSLRCV